MRRLNPTTRLLTFAAACLACSTISLADHKPGHNPGGDGGGGGGGTSPYTIVPFLPPDFASVESYVQDLNEQGHAVGYGVLDGGDHQAVHLDAVTGVYTSLTGGWNANGVNNVNQIVGVTQIGELSRAAFWSTPSADPVELPPLAGDVNSSAAAINDAGIVVGSSNNGAGFVRGVVWRVLVDGSGEVAVDGPVPLPAAEGTADWRASDVGEAVNGAAIVAGSLFLPGSMAAVWLVELDPVDGSIMATELPVSLGTLGLKNPSLSYAVATNTIGDVCGESDGLPFIAPAGQFAQPLALPRNTIWGTAPDVNNFEVVVGSVAIKRKPSDTVLSAPSHAYLWRNGEPIDLEKQVNLGDWVRLSAANVINDAGVIAGWGGYDGQTRGFILIPIPNGN